MTICRDERPPELPGRTNAGSRLSATSCTSKACPLFSALSPVLPDLRHSPLSKHSDLIASSMSSSENRPLPSPRALDETSFHALRISYLNIYSSDFCAFNFKISPYAFLSRLSTALASFSPKRRELRLRDVRPDAFLMLQVHPPRTKDRRPQFGILLRSRPEQRERRAITVSPSCRIVSSIRSGLRPRLLDCGGKQREGYPSCSNATR